MALLALLALPRCWGLFPDGIPDPPVDSGAPPARCELPEIPGFCANWRCAFGAIGGRAPAQGTTPLTGDLAVDFSSYGGEQTVTVRPRVGGGAEVVYSDRDACSLTVTLVDGNNASLTWNGVELTGKGELTAAQRTALESLGRSIFRDAFVHVPLELGCQNDVPREYLAALVFPWQLLLKYDAAPNTRAQAIETLARASSCGYFGRRLDAVNGQPAGPMRVASSDIIPNAWGYFPLDAPGASEPTGQGLEGDLWGPCTAMCRGACGGDCTENNCTRIDTVLCDTDGGATRLMTFNCGVHDGCVRHDDCYDACHGTRGCGTWAAAVCRRGCDLEAVGNWGQVTGAQWAVGTGPFQRRADFVYRDAGLPTDCIGCVRGGTAVTVADGTQKPIDGLVPGQRIAAFDIAKGTLTVATIERVYVHQAEQYALDELVVSSGQRLELTGNHPVFTGSDFVAAEELQPGDAVFIVDEALKQTRLERIVAITRRSSATKTVYNLKTTAGNYFAADVLVHNKCLSADSLLETPGGPRPIEALAPGDVVLGGRDGVPVWTDVRAVYRKATVLPALPGRRLGPSVAVTENHVVSAAGRPAGELGAQAEAISGAVFDLDTGTGNYVAGGVLLEAANSPLACGP